MPSHSLSARVAGLLLPLSAIGAQTAWSPLPPTPGARSDLAAAYDPVRGTLVVSGGWTGAVNVTDTWTFDGATWTVAAPYPHLISSHRLAVLPAQGVLISFGGTDDVTVFNDTVAWDGTQWTTRQPAHVPPPRFSHAMTSDTARGVVVLFGGFCGTSCALDDTWEYDGVDWVQRLVATRPSARFSAGMAFDAARGRTVLFGGRTLATRVGETWTWDGTAWTGPATGGPSARSTPSMDYDPLRQRIVLFGGFTGAYPNDTWEHDGTAWQQRTPPGTPAGRGFAAMAFDPALGRTVLVAGGPGTVGNTVASYGPVNPAAFAVLGPGCGSLGLGVASLAWLGTACRPMATGLSPGAVGAFFAIGLSTSSYGSYSLPLDLTPFGLPGCTLGVAPDQVQFAAAASGSAITTIQVPNVSALLGVVTYVQALAAGPAATGGVTLSPYGRLVVGGL